MKKVREGLENSLKGRIELIDSYARVRFLFKKNTHHHTRKRNKKTKKLTPFLTPFICQISSMIEIEVEMASDVLAAEAASNVVRNN